MSTTLYKLMEVEALIQPAGTSLVLESPLGKYDAHGGMARPSPIRPVRASSPALFGSRSLPPGAEAIPGIFEAGYGTDRRQDRVGYIEGETASGAGSIGRTKRSHSLPDLRLWEIEAQSVTAKLLRMDLDQDNELSFEEWRQGMLTEPRLLQLFQLQGDTEEYSITVTQSSGEHLSMIDPNNASLVGRLRQQRPGRDDAGGPIRIEREDPDPCCRCTVM